MTIRHFRYCTSCWNRAIRAACTSAVVVMSSFALGGNVLAQDTAVEETALIQNDDSSIPPGISFLSQKGVSFQGIDDSFDGTTQRLPIPRAGSSWQELEWMLTGGAPEVIPLLAQQLDVRRAENNAHGAVYLWASASNLWPFQVLRLTSNITWGTLESPQKHTVFGRYVRVYPHSLSSQNKTIQVFRERFDLLKPKVLLGHSLLSYRFWGPTEDMFWVRSAAIKKTRQLVEENRSSSVLGGALSFNDIFTFSEKIDRHIVLGLRLVTRSLPQSVKKTFLKAVGTCKEAQIQGGSPLRREGETTMFAWQLVPTSVLQVVLGTESMRSTAGKTVVYLDGETLAPLLKEVYDHTNTLRRVVLSRASIFNHKQKQLAVPLETITFARHDTEVRVTSHAPQSFTSCASLPKKLQSPFFSPVKLGS